MNFNYIGKCHKIKPMRRLIFNLLIILSITLIFPAASSGFVLNGDTVWRGDVKVKDDVLVPEGATLLIMSGTRINIEPSDRTKSDPEYISSMTEILVRGKIEIKGSGKSPVYFRVKGEESPGLWGGIIIDGGSAHIRGSMVQNAATGIMVIKGKLNMAESVMRKNRYGLTAYEGASVFIKDSEITENSYGLFELGKVKSTYKNVSIAGNEKKDLYSFGRKSYRRGIKDYRKSVVYSRSSALCRTSYAAERKEYTISDRAITRIYSHEVLTGDTVWRGRVQIEGLVRVPPDVRLIIMPGTVIEFRKDDTNRDGIGENGLMMQGLLVAKGTKEDPVIFRSAEKVRRMGDWDAINIMNSDGAQNLVEYVQIEDAYRGLHFHFSNVMVNQVVLRNNYRGIQFQESAVELRGNYIYGNKSGIKARDSEIIFTDNYVFNNINGVNFFRTKLTAENNRILDNMNEGIKIREGTTVISNNIMDCNRYGLMISDSYFGKFNGNLITNNFETGVSVRDSDNIDLSGNFIQNSGFNGINTKSSGGMIKGNNICANGERGIGIQSFSGMITENSIAKNGLYAIENESRMDILAPLNWWGERRADRFIYDKFDNGERGVIIFSPAAQTVQPLEWKLNTIVKSVKWYGAIAVNGQVQADNVTLTIGPGSNIVFAEGAGLKVSGSRIIAKGRSDNRILFTSASKDPERLWGEVLLEQASGSIFSYCDFEYASWAVHSHFSALKVSKSTFMKNDGGMRFRSGPVDIRESVFTENRIGMRAFMANAVISDNIIFNNETGIFVREKGGGLKINNNNIYSNTSYNIRVGDFDIEDVEARGNWWGTVDPAETIFDGRREPGIGRVIFEPFLEEEIPFGKEEEETEEGAKKQPQG